MENQTKHQDHRNQITKMEYQQNYDQAKEARKQKSPIFS